MTDVKEAFAHLGDPAKPIPIKIREYADSREGRFVNITVWRDPANEDDVWRVVEDQDGETWIEEE